MKEKPWRILKNRQDVTLSLEEAGLSGKVKARDVMYHKDLGTFKKDITMSLEPQSCSFFILSR